MNKIKLLVLLGLALSFGGCSLPFAKQNYAGLQINSDPQSAVYIDGKHVGESNYNDNKLKPTEHIVKLSPLSGSTDPWETKVKLLPGLTTVINKSFGTTPQESSHYVLQLEKITNKKVAELSIVTTPENVIVRLDDQPKGFSPLNNVGVNPEEHKVTLSAPGYKTLNITINPQVGYRLVVYAELGKSLALQPVDTQPTATPSATTTATPSPTSSPKPSPKASPTPTATPKTSPSPTPKPTTQVDPAKPYVEIQDTPTGWLRVRSEPNGLVENEVARVNSGDKLPYIESNDTGWHKIEYAPGKQGWVVSQYARLVK